MSDFEHFQQQASSNSTGSGSDDFERLDSYSTIIQQQQDDHQDSKPSEDLFKFMSASSLTTTKATTDPEEKKDDGHHQFGGVGGSQGFSSSTTGLHSTDRPLVTPGLDPPLQPSQQQPPPIAICPMSTPETVEIHLTPDPEEGDENKAAEPFISFTSSAGISATAGGGGGGGDGPSMRGGFQEEEDDEEDEERDQFGLGYGGPSDKPPRYAATFADLDQYSPGVQPSPPPGPRPSAPEPETLVEPYNEPVGGQRRSYGDESPDTMADLLNLEFDDKNNLKQRSDCSIEEKTTTTKFSDVKEAVQHTTESKVTEFVVREVTQTKSDLGLAESSGTFDLKDSDKVMIIRGHDESNKEEEEEEFRKEERAVGDMTSVKTLNSDNDDDKIVKESHAGGARDIFAAEVLETEHHHYHQTTEQEENIVRRQMADSETTKTVEELAGGAEKIEDVKPGSKTSECPCCPCAWFNPSKLPPRVADLVYWRDVKKSGVVFGVSLVTLLSLACCSFISVVAYLLLAVMLGTLSFRVYKSVLQVVQKTENGHPFKECLEYDLTLPKDKVQSTTALAVQHLECMAIQLRRLFLVEDIVASIKFTVMLWCFTYIGSWFNGLTLFTMAFVALFTLPKIYETYQTQIDHYLNIVASAVRENVNKIKAKIPIGKKEKKQ